MPCTDAIANNQCQGVPGNTLETVPQMILIGFVVKEDNANSLQECIEKCIADPQCKVLGALILMLQNRPMYVWLGHCSSRIGPCMSDWVQVGWGSIGVHCGLHARRLVPPCLGGTSLRLGPTVDSYVPPPHFTWIQSNIHGPQNVRRAPCMINGHWTVKQCGNCCCILKNCYCSPAISTRTSPQWTACSKRKLAPRGPTFLSMPLLATEPSHTSTTTATEWTVASSPCSDKTDFINLYLIVHHAKVPTTDLLNVCAMHG